MQTTARHRLHSCSVLVPWVSSTSSCLPIGRSMCRGPLFLICFLPQNLEVQPPQLVRGLQDPNTSTPAAACRCRAHLISSLGETLRTGEAQWPRGAHVIYTKAKRGKTRSSRTRRTHIIMHAGKDSTQTVLPRDGGKNALFGVRDITLSGTQ